MLRLVQLPSPLQIKPKLVLVIYQLNLCTKHLNCVHVCRHHHHHHHVAIKKVGHLLTRSGLTHPEVSSMDFLLFFCL
jgi:hypothetical protein